jgi:hypothetical protein
MVEKEIYKLAGEINPLSVMSYLKNMGWEKIKSKREHIVIFNKQIGTLFEEILLPLVRTFADFNTLMVSAVKSISIIEDREDIQVLSDLLIAKPADVIRIRLSSEDTKEGTISFEDGFKLFENARMTLYTAACDVIQPEIYHKRLSFKEADQFIEQCRWGQTERGSFIASIICPFINESVIEDSPKQFTLFDDPKDYTSSFTRKITTQIMNSIKTINYAIENDELESIEKGTTETKISANFLESIVNIKQLNNDNSAIQFISTWSSLAPVKAGVPTKIEIQKDFVSAIDSIVDKMIPKNTVEIADFVGKVLQVRAEPDVLKRTEGEVTFNLIGAGGKSFTAKTILAADKYIEACKAHEDGKNIMIKGKLISNRKSKVIENPDFKILTD